MEIAALGRLIPSLKEFFSILLTFGMTVFAWIFFRAENISHAFSYISGIFSGSLFEIPYLKEESSGLPILPLTIILMIMIFLCVEWIGRENQYAIQKIGNIKIPIIQYFLYYLIIVAIIVFNGTDQAFIYFQF